MMLVSQVSKIMVSKEMPGSNQSMIINVKDFEYNHNMLQLNQIYVNPKL